MNGDRKANNFLFHIRSVSCSAMLWSLFQAPMHVYIFTITGSIKVNVKFVTSF